MKPLIFIEMDRLAKPERSVEELAPSLMQKYRLQSTNMYELISN